MITAYKTCIILCNICIKHRQTDGKLSEIGICFIGLFLLEESPSEV